MCADTNTVKIEVWIWWEIGAKYNDCDRSWIAIKCIHFFIYRTIEIAVIQNCYRGHKNYYRYCPRRWRVLERFWSSFLRNRNWALISHQFYSSIFTVFSLAHRFTIYIQPESLLSGRSNGYIFIQNGALLKEMWAGWIQIMLCKFKLHCYLFCSASFAPVLRSVSVWRSLIRRLQPFTH